MPINSGFMMLLVGSCLSLAGVADDDKTIKFAWQGFKAYKQKTTITVTIIIITIRYGYDIIVYKDLF